LRSSQRFVVARLAFGSLMASAFLVGAPISAAAHPMTPASYTNALGDATIDQGTTPLSCQQPGAPPPPCYGPAQLQAAYDVSPLLNSAVTGSGSTIVIIDAFQDPTLESDVSVFDRVFGLSAPDLAVHMMDGLPPFDGSKLQISWAVEIATDVEWAHAIAPGATIQLVLAKSEQDADLLAATKYAVDNNLGDVLSQSFSEAESCPSAQFLADEHAVFSQAVTNGTSLFAASGDFGPAQHSCDGSLVAGVGTPASDPLVTAVGGTRLIADVTTGQRIGEVGWGDHFGASGGGFSAVYRRPGFQAPFIKDNSARAVPDVAWSSDVFGFTPVAALGRRLASFGTSAATAEWAAVGALGVQAAGHRLGSLNTLLYHAAKGHAAIGSLRDITSGNNSFAGFTGFSAGDGWDAVTGLGTPDVALLVAWFVRAS
jgi:subtilase family serine protease